MQSLEYLCYKEIAARIYALIKIKKSQAICCTSHDIIKEQLKTECSLEYGISFIQNSIEAQLNITLLVYEKISLDCIFFHQCKSLDEIITKINTCKNRHLIEIKNDILEAKMSREINKALNIFYATFFEQMTQNSIEIHKKYLFSSFPNTQAFYDECIIFNSALCDFKNSLIKN